MAQRDRVKGARKAGLRLLDPKFTLVGGRRHTALARLEAAREFVSVRTAYACALQ